MSQPGTQRLKLSGYFVFRPINSLAGQKFTLDSEKLHLLFESLEEIGSMQILNEGYTLVANFNGFLKVSAMT
jgi:hypothetical protein